MKNRKPGDRHGRLTLIKEIERTNPSYRRFQFKCDCGVITEGPWHNTKTSCGCLQIERIRENNCKKRKAYGEANFNVLLGGYKKAAERRGNSFTLSTERFKELTSSNCRYCGKPPSRIIDALSGKSKVTGHPGYHYYGPYICNGIDRVDSTKGYDEGNVVPCCWRCNCAKAETDAPSFVRWVTGVSDHLKANPL